MIKHGAAYAWEEDGKWCLSKFTATESHSRGGPRPINRYDSQAELVTEAGQMGVQVTWNAGAK